MSEFIVDREGGHHRDPLAVAVRLHELRQLVDRLEPREQPAELVVVFVLCQPVLALQQVQRAAQQPAEEGLRRGERGEAKRACGGRAERPRGCGKRAGRGCAWGYAGGLRVGGAGGSAGEAGVGGGSGGPVAWVRLPVAVCSRLHLGTHLGCI